jgi:hypothetical protein
VAKLKAPLLSLGASGQIGKSVVFFPWKGLNAAREYVIPTNPKSEAQQTQRGYLTDAVDKIHFCQATVGILFGADDATSYALLGSTYATPRTWFNTIVKQWIDQKVAGLIPAVFSKGSCTPGAEKATMTIAIVPESGTPTTCTVNWGTSKTNLMNSTSATPAELEAGKEIGGLTAGVKYYFQVRCTAPADYVGTNSGIWHATPTAS